jgi:hypothetical protein
MDGLEVRARKYSYIPWRVLVFGSVTYQESAVIKKGQLTGSLRLHRAIEN